MSIEFYKVGGYVRDEILGLKSKDIDYTVVGPSYAAMKAEIERRGGEIFLEKEEYLTIRAKVPGMGACDFVCSRKDGDYYDGRRPESVEMGTLEDDLARRDFTMNAIAKDESGRYIDPHGGQSDLKAGIIRCVGTPRERFEEDYLRILRAIRFAVTKDMDFSYGVYGAIYALAPKVAEVSVERVREELLKAFMCNTYKTLGLLSEFGLDQVLFDLNDLGLRLKPTLEK